MATLKQRKLAEEIIKNYQTGLKKNKKELLVSGGYSELVANHKPEEIIKQKGVQSVLAEYGFTEEAAKAVVSELLHSHLTKQEVRLNAAKEIFKVQGSYAPEKTQSLKVNIDLKADPKNVALLEEYEKKLQETLEEGIKEGEKVDDA